MPELPIVERNARVEALGRYSRWLLRRYQKLDLVEIADLPDPIELRQVFVPMRVGIGDIRDEDMGRDLADIHREELPGEDAWEVLARESFVALSGRPGSGKSTLVQAIVAELCGEAPSRLRETTRAIPVPFILRSLPDLDQVKSLEDLTARWWPLQEEQAKADKLPLDVPRLQEVLFPSDLNEPLEMPVLLLIDGIDEIGGPKVRQRLLDVAYEAHERGYRVLVTGRPTGYKDLTERLTLRERGVETTPQLSHLLPFAWPQIEQFIGSWYCLRDEWERRRQAGIGRFLEHLANRSRPHLLSLARRPIFLTLMALVHCTQNEMPEGRPLLYRRIIELYLERQERHRQRERTVGDRPMPHWPVMETRLVLAHLAWLSQARGSQAEHSYDPESRRVIWPRVELEGVIRHQLENGPGRFTVLSPEDSPELLNYFLHPAGLLVEPAESSVQFAHLSFQEYLCAWFLHERGKIEGLHSYLKRELFPRLGRPGWEEVGLLLFCIHADETGQEGHFELLRWLNLSQGFHAALFVTALTGRELPFTGLERHEKLPLAVACALVHPNLQLGRSLARIREWEAEGLSLLKKLLKVGTAREGLMELVQTLPTKEALQERWQTPVSDATWTVDFGEEEARAYSLLRLLNETGWVKPESDLNPIADPTLEKTLAHWIGGQAQKGKARLLWARVEDIPDLTNAGREMEVLLPDRGELWRRVTAQVPIDGWLFHSKGSSYSVNRISILLTLYPWDAINPRNRLALVLYQVQVLLESVAEGRASSSWVVPHFRLLKLSWPLLARPRSLGLSLLRRRPRPLDVALSQRLSLSVDLLTLPSSLMLPLWLSWSSLSESTRQVLNRFLMELRVPSFLVSAQVSMDALAAHGLRVAALDWFAEQVEDPDLMQRRGLRPAEPLPATLGLFDKKGRPLTTQRRSAWRRLLEWLDDEEALLAFAFPKGLASEEEEICRKDLAILRKQPWSPQAGVRALLEGWPAAEEKRTVTLEDSERRLFEACKKALVDLEGGPKRKRRD